MRLQAKGGQELGSQQGKRENSVTEPLVDDEEKMESMRGESVQSLSQR